MLTVKELLKELTLNHRGTEVTISDGFATLLEAQVVNESELVYIALSFYADFLLEAEADYLASTQSLGSPPLEDRKKKVRERARQAFRESVLDSLEDVAKKKLA